MLKIFYFSIFCLIASSANALNPSETHHPHKVTTVDFLYEACSSVGETAYGDIPFFDCESYVYGVLDAYLAIRPLIPKEKRACFPKLIPPWKVLEEVRPLILKNDASDSRVAGVAIIEALRIKYPCPKIKSF